jgi:hypothetical protein
MTERLDDPQRADKERASVEDMFLAACTAKQRGSCTHGGITAAARCQQCTVETAVDILSARSAGTASVDLTKLDVMKLYDEAFESTFPTLHGEPPTVPVLQVMALREFARRLVGTPQSASEALSDVERRGYSPNNGRSMMDGQTKARATEYTTHSLIDEIADFVQDVVRHLDEKAPGNERVIEALNHVAGSIGVMKLRIQNASCRATNNAADRKAHD